jgi:glyoxylase-like metal-dependent hydrolase (beta-lactamase superfamily II)
MAHSESIAYEVVRVPAGIANSYIVGSPARWVLIDSGTPGNVGNIRKAVEKHLGHGARPEAIVLTHGHLDHSGSARELAEYWDAEIYAHRMEMPFVDGTSKYPPPDPTVGGFMSQVVRFLPNKKMDLSPHLRELAAGKLPWISGWEIIETPGHTPGHLSFFRREDATLIAGDAFTTVNQDSMTDALSQRQQVSRPPAYYTPDWEQAEESVKRLASLNPRVLAAGHGIPMSGAHAATQLRALAHNFPIPKSGRYVSEPVQTDEHGIVYLPPPVPDPIKTGLLIALGVAGAVSAGIVARRRMTSSRASEPEIDRAA